MALPRTPEEAKLVADAIIQWVRDGGVMAPAGQCFFRDLERATRNSLNAFSSKDQVITWLKKP